MLEEDKANLVAAVKSLQEAVSQVDSLKGQQQAKLKEIGTGERDQGVVRGQITAIKNFITETNATLKTAEERTVKLQQEVSTRQGKKDEAQRVSIELAVRLKQAAAKFSERLAQASFSGEDDYSAARMSPEDLERFERDLSAYREKVAAATRQEAYRQAAHSASLLKAVLIAFDQPLMN